MSQIRTINWVEYPNDQPTQNGFYLVTLRNEKGQNVTGTLYYSRGGGWFCLAIGHQVLAYADLPEPYKPEEE